MKKLITSPLVKRRKGQSLHLNKEIVASFPFGTSLPQFETVFPIVKLVNEYFLGKKVSEVKILSTKFNSVFSQAPGFNTLLPVNLTEEIKRR